MDSDAGRHLMNGALLLDMIRDGRWTDPIAYTKAYYTRLPALSMPYHPPVFPAMEAVWFAMFGVDYSVARGLIAITTAIGATLLYLLVLRTHRSAILAAAVTIISLALGPFVYAGSEVMLEMPSLVFALLALHAVVWWTERESSLTLGPALAFAGCGAAAIWTKQHWVFLVAVPVLMHLFARRWRRLFRKDLWVSSALLSLAAVGVVLFAKMAGVGNTRWRTWTLYEFIAHHTSFYLASMREEVTLAGVVLIAVGTVVYCRKRSRIVLAGLPEDVYAAWAVSGAAMLIVLPPWNPRYLFHIWPPLIVLALAAVPRRPRARHAVALAAIAAVFLVLRNPLMRTKDYYGHVSAAQTLISMAPKRILYCGSNPGSIVYALRKQASRPAASLILGDKLPSHVMADTARSRAFYHDYGINAVVFETGGNDCRIEDVPLPGLEFIREHVVTSERGEVRGQIRIYRNHETSASPKSSLFLQSELLKGGMRMEY